MTGISPYNSSQNCNNNGYQGETQASQYSENPFVKAAGTVGDKIVSMDSNTRTRVGSGFVSAACCCFGSLCCCVGNWISGGFACLVSAFSCIFALKK